MRGKYIYLAYVMLDNALLYYELFTGFLFFIGQLQIYVTLREEGDTFLYG